MLTFLSNRGANSIIKLRTYFVLFALSNIGLNCAYADTIKPQELYTVQPTIMPELSKNGEYKVGVKTIKVINKNQLELTNFTATKDRSLTLEVWYPAQLDSKQTLASYNDVTRAHNAFSLQGEAYRDAPALSKGKFPIVILSHGYTGYRSIMFYMGEHLASHGYVVAAIDHTDSTNADIDFENNPGGGFLSTLFNRSRDQQFVLDYFSKDNSSLWQIIDTNQASVIGYSMGGYGAINTVGGCYNFTSNGLQNIGFPENLTKSLLPLLNFCNAGRSLVDPKWKAMVALAPWGQEHNVHHANSLASIDVPSLYIVGDEDDIVGYEHGVKKLFEQSSMHNNYLMVFENARHNVAPHPAPKISYLSEFEIGQYIEPVWSNERLNRVNEHMVLAFLDCHVKEDSKRCAYLPTREDITQTKQDNGKLSEAWPGFADRWGAGVLFYRRDATNKASQ
ncbi:MULTISPECIES: alpha/beta hydrolase family protein [Aliiglaciecola]|uniref:alpha/beta hydrolase family protein n=1 Tax=Aliiglaciecola TaxID=1406885 RepID=UPI001C07FFB3|nr:MULTISPECIES: prolyl oligopeptidase family serine peptidase [Aliiglaciecola]MBU2876681.1 prolyl oligopeptidase family serine peptidase [Aliiglaciecola lipolytica]MDO6710272.1 prolyl oligopeptidase family serine peptidase [Aliiglaciecola sp. 2_MG-2023]MDO6751420.1 prolyl oligopeptidase family serine peptidase [Aliiglaciecola sp. 1_MG-2023]